MADEKMTKEKLLVLRAAKAEAANPKPTVEQYLAANQWMSREQAEEAIRVALLPEDEQEAYYLEQDKNRIKRNLLGVNGVDEALAERLIQGGVKYFHTIASSLPYEVFHDIAHQMIGQPAAGC